tara:strand:- start:428 stop:541 length:114 start_codon:yes stop_codon:yes gene_type:complete
VEVLALVVEDQMAEELEAAVDLENHQVQLQDVIQQVL